MAIHLQDFRLFKLISLKREYCAILRAKLIERELETHLYLLRGYWNQIFQIVEVFNEPVDTDHTALLIINVGSKVLDKFIARNIHQEDFTRLWNEYKSSLYGVFVDSNNVKTYRFCADKLRKCELCYSREFSTSSGGGVRP